MEEEKKLSIGDIMVGLDIGTTKISVIIGRKNQYGKLEILGTGRSISNGVTRGTVANIDKTVSSIAEAIEEANQDSGIEIEEVFIGVAGQHIKSLQHRGEIVRDNIEIEITSFECVDPAAGTYRIRCDYAYEAMNQSGEGATATTLSWTEMQALATALKRGEQFGKYEPPAPHNQHIGIKICVTASTPRWISIRET